MKKENKSYQKRLSLWPLTPDEAIRIALQSPSQNGSHSNGTTANRKAKKNVKKKKR
jgi:hypothetical protein